MMIKKDEGVIKKTSSLPRRMYNLSNIMKLKRKKHIERNSNLS